MTNVTNFILGGFLGFGLWLLWLFFMSTRRRDNDVYLKSSESLSDVRTGRLK